MYLFFVGTKSLRFFCERFRFCEPKDNTTEQKQWISKNALGIQGVFALQG